MAPGLKDLMANITLAFWEVSWAGPDEVSARARARARADSGGCWRHRSHQKEAGGVGRCPQQVHRWGRGKGCVNLPPHQTDFRNHKPSGIYHKHHRLWECFGVFLAFLFFMINSHSSSFALITKIDFSNAPNIQISLMHTHSRKAEVRAATGCGIGQVLTAGPNHGLAGSWPLAQLHRDPQARAGGGGSVSK